jgi:hypothetical protein
MPAFLNTGLAAVVAFVPKLLLAIVILVVGLIVARLISKALSKLLERVGFDRLVERGGVAKALANSKLDASDLIAKILYYTLVLFVLQFAFGVFGKNPVSTLLGTIIAFLPKVIVAIIIVIIAAAIAKAVKTLIENALGGLSYGKVLANVASIFVIFIGAVAALNQVDIAVTVTTPILIAILTTVAGVIIVGVGGGLIKPMQQRWEGYLTKAEEEAPKVRQAAQQAPSAGEQAKAVKEKVRQAAQPAGQSAHPAVHAPEEPTPTHAAPVIDVPPPTTRDDTTSGN